MGFDMGVTATATSGQRIEIRRWQENYELVAWLMARAKIRGASVDIDGGCWATEILVEDVAELAKFANDPSFESFEFLENLELDLWDVRLWDRALGDGFDLLFFVG